MTREVVAGCTTHTLNIQFPVRSEQEIVDLYDEFLSSHEDIRVAVIDHITSPTAVKMPVKQIVEVCHRHDVIVLVDGAHAPGQLKVDILDIDADFYSGNLHKWVYAPRGCAFLWMNPHRKNDWLKPLITSISHGEGLSREFAYEGAKDDTSYLCAMEAINFYDRIGGIESITEYTSKLRDKAVSHLEQVWGTQRLPIPDSMVAPNLQMVLLPYIPKYSEDLTKHAELQKLIVNKYDIQTYIHHVEGCLYLRVSAQVYNTFEDFVKLSAAILELSHEE